MERKSLGWALGLAVACVLLVGAGMASAGITIETVPVGDVNNAADTTYGYGRVDYAYNIGKYEVTAGQYTAFLNAVAGVDTYALYNTDMARTDVFSGITRSGAGTPGNPYTYSVAADFVNRPVNSVSFWDCCRFANWLNNGQKARAQDANTTEAGAYSLNGVMNPSNGSITRNAGAQWAVTSEDEWYKAAYYDPNKSGVGSPGYWVYPTRSNTAPGRDITEATNTGNNANWYPMEGGCSGPFPIDNGYYTTLVGQFRYSASAYGTFDQGGNVAEWTEEIFERMGRGIPGGMYNFGVHFLAAGYLDWDGASGDGGSFHGFRVCQVPEPTSLGIVGLGVVGMLIRRRGAGR